VVLVLGVVLPRFMHMGQTFLIHRSSLAVAGALFLVGGWGLARDIGFERSLASERARAAALAREAEQAQLLACARTSIRTFCSTPERHRRVVPAGRGDAERAVPAAVLHPAHLAGGGAGGRAGRWSASWSSLRTLFLLHELRHGSAFTLSWEVAAGAGAAPVPPMILLPLAENAVKHGPPRGHRGTIRVAARPVGGQILCAWRTRALRGPRPGSAGLPMVERRLALAYGSARPDASAATARARRWSWSCPRRTLARGGGWCSAAGADSRRRGCRAPAAAAPAGADPGVSAVRRVPDGDEVLVAVREGGVDVVLLDIQMPGPERPRRHRLAARRRTLRDLLYRATPSTRCTPSTWALSTTCSSPSRPPACRRRSSVRARGRRSAAFRGGPPARAGPPAATALRRLAVPTRQGIVLLDPREISHAVLDGELVTIHAAGATLITDDTLQDLQAKLPAAAFERVHRRRCSTSSTWPGSSPTRPAGFVARTQRGHAVEVSRQAARNLRKRLGLRKAADDGDCD
jgi:CheY-like chemotaxis protein